MKRSRRLVSVFLTFVMLLGLVPAWSIPVNAMEEVKVRTWDELDKALWRENTAKIVLQNDIEKHIEYETKADFVNSEDPTINVYGTKILELNGYNITCYDDANVAYVPQTGQVETGAPTKRGFRMVNELFYISHNATLTVQDTASGKGGIHYDGYMIGTLGSGEKYKYHWYTTRDVFEVWGTLI